MIHVNGSGVEKRSAIRGLYIRKSLSGRALPPQAAEARILVEVPVRAEVLARVEGPVRIEVLARVEGPG